MLFRSTHRCPNCESDSLIVREVNSFELNTGDFYCHSVKAHDSDAEVKCLDCNWTGRRDDFDEQEE